MSGAYYASQGVKFLGSRTGNAIVGTGIAATGAYSAYGSLSMLSGLSRSRPAVEGDIRKDKRDRKRTKAEMDEGGHTADVNGGGTQPECHIHFDGYLGDVPNSKYWHGQKAQRYQSVGREIFATPQSTSTFFIPGTTFSLPWINSQVEATNTGAGTAPSVGTTYYLNGVSDGSPTFSYNSTINNNLGQYAANMFSTLNRDSTGQVEFAITDILAGNKFKMKVGNVQTISHILNMETAPVELTVYFCRARKAFKPGMSISADLFSNGTPWFGVQDGKINTSSSVNSILTQTNFQENYKTISTTTSTFIGQPPVNTVYAQTLFENTKFCTMNKILKVKRCTIPAGGKLVLSQFIHGEVEVDTNDLTSNGTSGMNTLVNENTHFVVFRMNGIFGYITTAALASNYAGVSTVLNNPNAWGTTRAGIAIISYQQVWVTVPNIDAFNEVDKQWTNHYITMPVVTNALLTNAATTTTVIP